MPAEKLAGPPIAVAPEQAERKGYTAAEFVLAFASIYTAEREIAAGLMNVSPHRLNPHYVGTHYATPEDSLKVTAKIEEIMNSGLCRDRVNRYADEHPAGTLLHEAGVVNFLADFSAICFAGAASDYLLAKGSYFQRLSDKREAKRRIVKAHEQFVKLTDSQAGSLLGMDRHHLRGMANIMYGKQDEPSNMPVWFEVGVSAEVATKKRLESIIDEYGDGVSVRYSATEEDLRGADIVLEKDGRKLLIDVKSSGRSILRQGVRKSAYHTPPEKDENGVFRIKELHPAGIESIGDDFSVDRDYEEELRLVVEEFNMLPAGNKKPRRHPRAVRHAPYGRKLRLVHVS